MGNNLTYHKIYLSVYIKFSDPIYNVYYMVCDLPSKKGDTEKMNRTFIIILYYSFTVKLFQSIKVSNKLTNPIFNAVYK